MGFLAPYMLFGSIAAGIPVIIHFLFRSRYRTVPWAAMSFLLTSIEQTSQRIKFQELLLLLLRMALLVILALAFSRPLSSMFLTGGSSIGETVDAVIIVDTSMSMSARQGNDTCLDHAKRSAQKILSQLPPYSTVQIISCSDKAELLGPRNPGKIEQAKSIIDSLSATACNTDMYPAVELAEKIVARFSAPHKEVYLLSDMRQQDWNSQSSPVKETLRNIDKVASLFFVRCGSEVSVNAQITAITPAYGQPKVGERNLFAVTVKNTGPSDIEDLNVQLVVNNQIEIAEKQSIAKLLPGETGLAMLSAKFSSPGRHVITAKIDTDDVTGDNTFDKVIDVKKAIKVLVVDGAPNSNDIAQSGSYYLLHALMPISDTERSNHLIQPTLITPKWATSERLQDHDLCILVDVAVSSVVGSTAESLSPEFLDSLADYVRSGRGLIIFGGDNVIPKEYNKELSKSRGLIPEIGGILERSNKNEQPLHFNRDTAMLSEFQKFKEDDYYKFINNVEVWKAIEFVKNKLSPDDQNSDEDSNSGTVIDKVLLKFDNNQPALLSRRVDSGMVIFVATSAYPGVEKGSADPTWTNWPLFPYFPPMIEGIVSHLLTLQAQPYNGIAGRILSRNIPKDQQEDIFSLYSPKGSKTKISSSTEKGRVVLTIRDLDYAGVYRMEGAKKNDDGIDILDDLNKQQEVKARAADFGEPIAITFDPAETQSLSQITDEDLDEFLGFSPVHIQSGSQQGMGYLDRTQREWTLWLLLMVLVLAAGELFLAWYCGRPLTVRVRSVEV